MKRIFFVSFFLFMSVVFLSPLQGQTPLPDVPHLLSYQGVLVEPDGVAVPNATYVVTIRLYETSVGGTPAWEETQSVVTLDGVFDAVLGLRTSLKDVPFDRQYWLAIELQGEREMTPRTMVVSAPYALRAYDASIADSLRGGVVRSINGLQGQLMIQGASGTTVTESGNTIIISSAGGGSDPSLSPGSIWYGDNNSKPTERKIGTPRQVLQTNAAGTEPEWTSSIDVQGVVTDSLMVDGYARFERIPDFPLGEGNLLIGSSNGRVQEFPSPNTPKAVLQIDASGRPTWQPVTLNNIGLTSGRVPTIGRIRQTITEVAVQAGSKIRVSYEDPSGGASINVNVIAQNAGTDFTVQFTALPPSNTFVVYEIIP
ncbi:MAG: hypothetical protein AB7H80_00420 [Candidatus Kapaibacterium sp.]